MHAFACNDRPANIDNWICVPFVLPEQLQLRQALCRLWHTEAQSRCPQTNGVSCVHIWYQVVIGARNQAHVDGFEGVSTCRPTAVRTASFLF